MRVSSTYQYRGKTYANDYRSDVHVPLTALESDTSSSHVLSDVMERIVFGKSIDLIELNALHSELIELFPEAMRDCVCKRCRPLPRSSFGG